MNIETIKQYGVGSLINAACFKILYKFQLAFFRCQIPRHWSNIEGCLSGAPTFNSFLSRCDSQVDLILDEANTVLNGKIFLFGEYYEFDPFHGWLNDPVTGGLWNKGVYFVEAPTKQDGLADVKYVLELNKFNHLVRVALAYYHTHDKRYTQFITKSIVGYRKTVKPYRGVVQRIIMDIGFRVINLVQILLLCKDDKEFQKQAAPLINGIIFDQVEAIERFHTAKWFKTGNGANHVTGEMVGLILGQLWLQQNGIANYEKKYKKEYAYLVDVLNRTIAPSGAYLEQSGNYSRLVSEFLVMFDLLKGCMGQQGYHKAYEYGHYRDRILQYLRDISYNDYVPNFGDNDDARVLTAFCGQGELVEYFLKDVNPSFRSEAYLDGSQWTFSSHDKYGIHLFTRVGKFAYFREGASIHAHNDLLAILLGVKGQPVFVDKGMRYYNSGSDIRKSYSQIAAHNTISIEGYEMTELGDGVSYQYPQCEYVKSDVKGFIIFSGMLKFGDVQHKRTIAYQDGRIEIKDFVRLATNEETNGSIRYLLDPQIKANKNAEGIVLSLPNKSILKVSVQGVESVELIKSDYSPSYGQSIETTMIKGYIKTSKETIIRTQIFV